MQGKKLRAGTWRRAGVSATLILGLAACQATVDNRGYVPDPEEVLRVKPGVQGRDEVREILGSPSSASTFTDDRWYYISRKTSTTAFFRPEILEQKVLEVDFDDGGIVHDVRNYTLKDGEQIIPF